MLWINRAFQVSIPLGIGAFQAGILMGITAFQISTLLGICAFCIDTPIIPWQSVPSRSASS